MSEELEFKWNLSTILIIALIIALCVSVMVGISEDKEHIEYKNETRAELGRRLDQMEYLTNQLKIYKNASSDLNYMLNCMNNVDSMYNDSYHRVMFAETCVREFATLNKIRIQNCLNFTYHNGSNDYLCGYAKITLMTEKLDNMNIANVSIYRRYKERS